jgi:hypothetical protein
MENDCMKFTPDPIEPLTRRIKIRADAEGRKLKDLIAEPLALRLGHLSLTPTSH